MGLERMIPIVGSGPTWGKVRECLGARGVVPQMRMIDNMPAFPDEEPEPTWGEIRLSLGHGMLTVRRQGGALHVIVWGNADAALLQDQDVLVAACTEAAQAS